MITGLLNNAGWHVNHERAVVERIWRRSSLLTGIASHTTFWLTSVLWTNQSVCNSFALNKPHVLDFALRNRSFSSLREQAFVCLWLKPCNFGSAHEAPSTP
jgi:hypothetical protein